MNVSFANSKRSAHTAAIPFETIIGKPSFPSMAPYDVNAPHASISKIIKQVERSAVLLLRNVRTTWGIKTRLRHPAPTYPMISALIGNNCLRPCPLVV